MTDSTLIGSRLRDADADPLPGDLMPIRPVRGHPTETMHAEVGEPEYNAAASAARAAHNPEGAS